ncbi:fumarate hydratase, partial [Candidatus Bathyarchaeota archaeon]
METKNVIENVAVELLRQAVTKLPPDVKEALQQAYREEESDVGKTQLEAILNNVELAEKTSTPMCQDTGVIIFYVKAGAQARNLDEIKDALINATRRATKQVPLRPNSVGIFTKKNTGDNTGRYIPYINWEITSGDTIELT